ncbi:hypothetical protein [Staphylococcus chromogenes]|uniref:hypothetical protein n=1 Tax=Staphylococcus chromogenes TaxID=46126 RepID=UPI0028835B10|nr:hypothetical protein [Staphylococcus chromogenes]MDT0700443.1 hypothetical protein [Staphylococcus chromogenes]
MNVQADSGLAKETFLPDRSLIVEKTRYSEKSYLLGFNEEPLKFKIRLLFDEHKLRQLDLMALRRWLHTTTYKELKFDTEEESNMHIVVYAMVTGMSELSHNVINDGYVDLEFTTNSSRRYSEIMEEEYDFTRSASEKILEEYDSEFSSLTLTSNNIGKSLKQYVARTNYANVEELFKDKNKDKLPDGWKLISGSVDDINLDVNGKLTLSNVHLRKRFNGNNKRNYYMRAHGNGGTIRIHENDYKIDETPVHEFVFRRNLLGHSGTFDLDSSKDGIGEGWTKVGDLGTFDIDKKTEFQTIKDGGKLTSPINIIDGLRYVMVAEDRNKNSIISIGSNSSSNNTNELNKMKFTGSKEDNSITIFSNDNKETKLSYIRVYSVTEKEFNEFDDLSDDEVRLKYPYFDSHAYIDLDFRNDSGYIDYIDLWELNDLNKSKLDKGTPIEKLVYFDYDEYLKMLEKYNNKVTDIYYEMYESFEKLSKIDGLNISDIQNKIDILFQNLRSEISSLIKGSNMKLYQWDDLQPHYKRFKEFAAQSKAISKIIADYIQINHRLIDGSHEIGTDKITVYNYGDKAVYPTFLFESRDGSDIMVRNIDTGEHTVITDNISGEQIKVIGSSEQIYSSRPAPYYKYNSHDDNFIRLKRGYNDLEFSGNYKLKITYQFVLL